MWGAGSERASACEASGARRAAGQANGRRGAGRRRAGEACGASGTGRAGGVGDGRAARTVVEQQRRGGRRCLRRWRWWRGRRWRGRRPRWRWWRGRAPRGLDQADVGGTCAQQHGRHSLRCGAMRRQAQRETQGAGRGIARGGRDRGGEGRAADLGPRLVAAPRRSLWCHAQWTEPEVRAPPHGGSGLQPREGSHATQKRDAHRAEVQGRAGRARCERGRGGRRSAPAAQDVGCLRRGL